VNAPNLTQWRRERFKNNKVSTAQYSWWSFLPKNLFYQLTKMANIYFLVMMGL